MLSSAWAAANTYDDGAIQSRCKKRSNMTDEERLRRNTEKAYQEALRAMFDLVNAITEERNYYREKSNTMNE